MARVLKSTKGRSRPTRAFPVLYRFVPNQAGHPINLAPSVRTAWHPYCDGQNTIWNMDRYVADTLAAADAEMSRPGAYIGCVIPQNFCELAPFGRLRGNASDRATGGPWTPFGDYSFFSDAGVAECLSASREYLTRVRDGLRARNYPDPRWWHFDLEEWTQSTGGWAADAVAGVPRGCYTPSLHDARAATEDIDGRGNTMARIEAARVAEGYTYDDTRGLFDPANIAFNFEFSLSWPARSWAMERAIYRIVRELFPASRVANFDDFVADNPAWPVPWSGRTAINQPWRATYGDAHAPVLYPPHPAAPSRQLSGESSEDFYVRISRMKVDGCRYSSRPDLPIFPWVLEPGMTSEGITITPELFARVLNDAWDRGAYEYFGWSDNASDPNATLVLDGWNQHLAYVAARL